MARRKVNTGEHSGQQVPGGESGHVVHPLLLQASKLIQGDRRSDYGPARDSFQGIATMWSIYLNHAVTATDVAMMMILFKVNRESYVHKDDNLVDIAGYTALGFDVGRP